MKREPARDLSLRQNGKGTVFGVPLPEKGGMGLAVVTRRAMRGRTAPISADPVKTFSRS